MQAEIRPYTEADRDGVVAMALLAWAPVFASFRRVLGPAIYARLFPDWETQQREAVEQACAERITSVAEVGGVVAGFVAYTLDDAEKTGEVYMLAVHPEYQRQGIGGALNDLALARMREAGMTLAVVNTGGDEGHAPARRAYERAGYTAFPQVQYYQRL